MSVEYDMNVEILTVALRLLALKGITHVTVVNNEVLSSPYQTEICVT